MDESQSRMTNRERIIREVASRWADVMEETMVKALYEADYLLHEKGGE